MVVFSGMWSLLLEATPVLSHPEVFLASEFNLHVLAAFTVTVRSDQHSPPAYMPDVHARGHLGWLDESCGCSTWVSPCLQPWHSMHSPKQICSASTSPGDPTPGGPISAGVLQAAETGFPSPQYPKKGQPPKDAHKCSKNARHCPGTWLSLLLQRHLWESFREGSIWTSFIYMPQY